MGNHGRTPDLAIELGQDRGEESLLELEILARKRILTSVRRLRRRPLIDVDAPAGPGAYLLWRQPITRTDGFYDRLYRPFELGRPLYVGKVSPSTGLDSRLAVHTRSIDQAAGLDTADFFCATLSTRTGAFASYVEAVLLEEFGKALPLNGSGFGARDPGRKRKGQKPSLFDALHEGRRWASNDLDQGARALAALRIAQSGAMPPPPSLVWGPIV